MKIMTEIDILFWFQAGEKAVSCGVSNVYELKELAFVKDLHIR